MVSGQVKYCWVIIMIICGWSVRAQVDYVDLPDEFDEEGHDKIEVLSNLFDLYENEDPERSFGIATRTLDLALNSSQSDITFALNLMAYAYINVEKFDSAMYYSQQTLDRAAKYSDSAYIAKAYNNMGVVHFNTGDYERGLYYFEKSARIERSSGDLEGAIVSYHNLGSICWQLGRQDSAEVFSKLELELAEKTGDKERIAGAYVNLGIITAQSDLREAENFFFRAIELNESLGNYRDVSVSYRNLARAFQIQGQYQMAVKYDSEGLKYAKYVNSPELMKESYIGLSTSYEALGFYNKALAAHKQYTAWKDTVSERANKQLVIEMMEKYESEETKKENQILTQQNSIAKLENDKNRERLNNSRIIMWSSAVGLLLLIGLVFSLYARNRLKAKTNLELTKANQIINEKNQDITASLEYASKIQEALLPSTENIALFDDSLFLLRPKDIVSGDFFWYTQHNGKKIFTAVDCTGHGVPGAFMSMIGTNFLHEIIKGRGITKPSEILDELREKVIQALNRRDARKDGMDMALCSLDEKEMVLEYAGANNPLYLIRENEIQEIKADKQPVGYMPERSKPFTNHRLPVQKGDKVYIFSDGYVDQFGGPKGKKFKYKQFRELLLSIHTKPMAKQKKILVDRFVEWKGEMEQIDDVCLVGVQI